MYNLAVIGDGYRRSEEALFLSDYNLCKSELLMRPPFLQRQSQINMYSTTWQNSLRCKAGNLWEGTSCSGNVVGKVNAFGQPWNAILVIIKNQGSGGAVIGGQIAAAGMILHSIESGGVSVHEMGHVFGLYDGSGALMSAAGGGTWNTAFTPEQQVTINNRLNQLTGFFTSNPPTMTITTPPDNYSIQAGGSLLVHADMSIETTSVQVFWDGEIKASNVFWARSYYSNPTNGMTFWISPLSVGNHICRVVATGINNFAEQSINITIN